MSKRLDRNGRRNNIISASDYICRVYIFADYTHIHTHTHTYMHTHILRVNIVRRSESTTS
jgi:hypothetical protein